MEQLWRWEALGEAPGAGVLPGREAGAVSAGIGLWVVLSEQRSHVTRVARPPHASSWAGLEWAGRMQISQGRQPILERAEGPWDPGRWLTRKLSSLPPPAFASGETALRAGSVVASSTSLFSAAGRLRPDPRGGQGAAASAEAEVRRGAGAAALGGARAGPRLCSVLHASGARPASEQQQP